MEKIGDGRIVSPFHEVHSTLIVQPSSALTLTVQNQKWQIANSPQLEEDCFYLTVMIFFMHTTICSTLSTVNANLLAKDINFTNEAFTDLREEDWKLKRYAQVSRCHAMKESFFCSFFFFWKRNRTSQSQLMYVIQRLRFLIRCDL